MLHNNGRVRLQFVVYALLSDFWTLFILLHPLKSVLCFFIEKLFELHFNFLILLQVRVAKLLLRN